MIKHKVYLFFKITDDPDLYAYTLNRDYAEFFMNTRNMKKFMMKTKKIDHSILHDNLNKPLMPNEEKRIHRKRMIILIV